MSGRVFVRRIGSYAGLALIVLSVIVMPHIASCMSNEGDTDSRHIPYSRRGLLATDMYYEIDNLAEAANALRRDADRFGLDVYEHPPTNKADHPYSSLSLHVTDISPDFGDLSYLSVLAEMRSAAGDTDQHVAILSVNRELSIDEVAGLFEAGIRVLDRLLAGPHDNIFGGYIVQGSARALFELQGHDYFAWLSEYSADLKRQVGLSSSSIDLYIIHLFKKQVKQSYIDELKELGASVEYQSPEYKRIVVKCSWDVAVELCAMLWVRSISSEEPWVWHSVQADGVVYFRSRTVFSRLQGNMPVVDKIE